MYETGSGAMFTEPFLSFARNTQKVILKANVMVTVFNRTFQQYFSYISYIIAVSFIGEGNMSHNVVSSNCIL